MNFKHILCIAFIGLSTIASAQKYKSISTSTIKKDWQGTTFTSDKTLQENLAQSTSFSFMATILEDEFLSSQLSSQEMVTVFVANDASFMALKEDTRKTLLADDQKITQLVKFVPLRRATSPEHDPLARTLRLRGAPGPQGKTAQRSYGPRASRNWYPR